jgi:hypothetical protein
MKTDGRASPFLTAPPRGRATGEPPRCAVCGDVCGWEQLGQPRCAEHAYPEVRAKAGAVGATMTNEKRWGPRRIAPLAEAIPAAGPATLRDKLRARRAQEGAQA